MNTLTSPTQICKPQAGDFIATPFVVGVMDAEEGLPFAPEMYFVIMNDLLDYTEGFEEVAGESEITRSFKAQWPEPEHVASIEDDYEFIRRGGAGGFL